NFRANDPVKLTGTLPTGISANTIYYVSATGLSIGGYQVSAAPGGASINTSGSASGNNCIYLGLGSFTDDSAMWNGVDNSGALSMTGGTGGVASTTLTITAVGSGTPV